MPLNKYFAYGSCMNEADFRRSLQRAGLEKDYIILGVTKLSDYRLAFTRYSYGREGGVLDMLPSPGDYVLGIVYEVTDRALKEIDRREGVYVGAYYRDTVQIQVGDEVVEAYTYFVKDKLEKEIPPSEEYQNIVYEAMKQASFPDEYIKKYFLDHIKIINGEVINKENYIYDVEVYDSSRALDNTGVNVIGMPKSLREQLEVEIGEIIHVKYEGKEATLQVHQTDSRLLIGGSAPADDPSNHVCIPKVIREKLGLIEQEAYHRRNYSAFRKKFSSVTICK